MTSARTPLIGIPTRTRVTGSKALADEMRRAYAQAVAGVGGIPVLLPLVGEPEPSRVATLLERLDGLLLAGGCDVDPAHYGEAPHPRLGEIDPARDRWELALGRFAVDHGLPVLGLCRGHQVLAVVSGGALWQDLPSQHGGAVVHDLEVGEALHPVTVEPASRLGRILGGAVLTTNSRHHQAAKTLGPGWVATAWSEDGVVEAIELPGHPFALGVQWHPEDLQDQPAHRAVLAAFIAASSLDVSAPGR